MAGRVTLSQAEKDLVVELYDGCGLTRDNLPYNRLKIALAVMIECHTQPLARPLQHERKRQ